MKHERFGRWIGYWLLAMLVWGLLGAQAQTLSKEVRERIIAATVLITYPLGNGLSIGSGTLISPDGYILTNYHVIGDIDSRTTAPKITVGTIRFVDQPPELKYLAEVVAADPNLDLAVIRITRLVNGQPAGKLNLPAVPIGDSNQLLVGDPIYVFGFQGTGGYTLTFSRGAVGGFTGEDKETGGKQWIKHDAQTGPGNSGGGVFNQDGELIGVHSAGVSGEHNSRTAFMRPIALAWGLMGPNVPNLARANPSPATTPTTPTNWPPTVAQGQTWQVQVQGGQWTGTWTVALSGKDSDGDLVGNATLGNRKLNAVMFQRENILRLNLGDDKYPYARCRFDPQSFSGSMQGKLYLFKDANTDSEEIGTCVAVVRGAAQTPPANPSAAWPPKLAVGQKWQVTVKGDNVDDLGTVTLSERDNEGDPKGTVVFKDNFTLVSYFYIGKSTGAALLDMTEADGANSHSFWYRCRFEQQSFTGTLRGTLQTFDTDKDGNISNLKDVGSCTATLK
ncbi:MAG TPA: serine protease [Meiothermus sp.]|nr:serine protease [Meiothermus sp.]